MRHIFSNIVGILTVASILTPLKAVQAADFVMIPNSFSDRVLLFDVFDGSLVDDNFIDGAGLFQTPINAIQVNNEVWVFDQLADSIFRFDLQGQLLSTITGGLDNIRGLEFVNNQVYVTSAGTDNSAAGLGIVIFDTTGNNTGFFATGNPYDVFANTGELLVSNIADNNLDRYDLGSSFLGTLHNSDGVNGISFPQQINSRDNNLLVGGFSTPAGIYEYAPDGTQIGRYTSTRSFY